jgi:hypothetical protein
MPETCSAAFKRQVINLKNCCIWLVDSLERLKNFSLTESTLPKACGKIPSANCFHKESKPTINLINGNEAEIIYANLKITSISGKP